jgi:hypothetical protein
MREQMAYHSIPKRTSAPQVSRAYAGHSAAIHPEEDEEEYPAETRPGTSAIRYTDTRGNQVIRQGNRKIVVHREPPKKRRAHWMFFVGLAMFIMVFGWIAFGALANWWQDKQNDWTYGNPRTFQIDQAVGINDPTQMPSHFIAMNLHGDVFVIDIEGGNPTKAQSIPIIGLSSDHEGDPVTISFQDVNGDGKLDMIVHVAGFTIVFLNNGKTFIAQHQ